jgi:hypothetical protein
MNIVQTTPVRWRTGLSVLLGCTLSLTAVSAIAGDDSDGPLSSQRWHERAHGLSLRPPLGSRIVSYTADDAFVRILAEGPYTITAYLKKSPESITLDRITQLAIEQLGLAQPSAKIIDQRPFQAGDWAGQVIYFLIPPSKTAPAWAHGQAFIQLNDHEFVILKLHVDHARFDAVRGAFEAVVRSLERQDPNQLGLERAARIAAGDTWRQSLDVAKIHQSLQSDQWFRIVDQENDIGYMRIREQTATEMNLAGVRVDIQARIVLGKATYDSISNFFASDDGRYEVWSVRTTQRGGDTKTAQTAQDDLTKKSWAETGLRSDDQITVTIQNPTGSKEYHWQRPPKAYLSQVDLHLLERLLPPDSKTEYGFYAYYPNTAEITYRVSRVDRSSADGNPLVVCTRPSPDQEEQVSYYDRSGRLLKRVLAEGRTTLPASQQQLASLWNLK